MEKPVGSPLEQLKNISETMEERWQRVVDALMQATLEYLPDMTNAEKLMLREDFWHTHPLILGRAELIQPGITDRIITRSEHLVRQRK